MKVVHLCLGCFFPDNYSYQENMLPKFHKQLGCDVEVIASLATFDKDGQPAYLKEKCSYQNEYDIKVTRLDYKTPIFVNRKLKNYVDTYQALVNSKPDVLFIHGCQFIDMKSVVDFLKKNSKIRVYVDNHADFSNSGKNWISKNILHKILWKHSATIIEPYTRKFYGVLPARVDWLIDMYKLPKQKCELLVMGADDDQVSESKKKEVYDCVRSKHGIKKDDFLIMTGGKIDKAKSQILDLMDAVINIGNKNVKLLIFGSVTPELRAKIDERCIQDKIIYIGWINSNDTYKYFASSDLVVFPGRHSVFWEQVSGMGIPMICKYWKGTTHIDVGGNVKFIKNINTVEIQNMIEYLLENPSEYINMRKIGEEKGMDTFSYKKIAERSVEL